MGHSSKESPACQIRTTRCQAGGAAPIGGEVPMSNTERIAQLEKEMYIAAKNLQFERAARLRDKIKELKEVLKSGIRNK